MAVPEIFIKLAVGFDEDPKVVSLAQFGDDAGLGRDLYLAMCRYCRRGLTDGYVPPWEVSRLAWPLAEQHAQQLAKQLATVELISEVSTGGWIVNAYVKRNGTRADAEALSAIRSEMGRRGRSAGQRDAGAKSQANGYATSSASSSAESESESETSRVRAPARGAAARRGGTATPPPVSHVLAQSRRTGPPADPHEWAAKARAGLPAHEPSTTDTVTNADAPPNDPAPGPGDDPPLVDDPEAADEFPF